MAAGSAVLSVDATSDQLVFWDQEEGELQLKAHGAREGGVC